MVPGNVAHWGVGGGGGAAVKDIVGTVHVNTFLRECTTPLAHTDHSRGGARSSSGYDSTSAEECVYMDRTNNIFHCGASPRAHPGPRQGRRLWKGEGSNVTLPSAAMKCLGSLDRLCKAAKVM